MIKIKIYYKYMIGRVGGKSKLKNLKLIYLFIYIIWILIPLET